VLAGLVPAMGCENLRAPPLASGVLLATFGLLGLCEHHPIQSSSSLAISLGAAYTQIPSFGRDTSHTGSDST
jgi:hypothetical protein